MCGIVGWCNTKKSVRKKQEKMKEMTGLLEKRGPDAEGYYFDEHTLLGHRRLSIIDLEGGKQPMTDQGYTIIYNGELYNTEELRHDLQEKGYTFTTTSDTEVLLKSYIHYKKEVLSKLDGIFAFAIYHDNTIFIARDRLGVKPLFYSKKKHDFVFASEIKSILKSEVVKPIINKKGLQELLSLGPSKIPGSGVFKDIYELRAGHYMIYKNGKIKIKRYWNIENKNFTDNYSQTIEHVKKLVTEAVEKQMVSDVGVGSFLSGGLDSSIISSIGARYINPEVLKTYSIDYEGNQKYFQGNDYQVSEDKYYIDLFSKEIGTEHNYKVMNQKTLARLLKDAMIARDLPGMADIDSSLLWFSKEVRKEQKVVLSGEGADEIFGGYPWYYKEELQNIKGFPWIRDLHKREELLNKKLQSKLKLQRFAYRQYKKTIKEIPKIKNKEEQKHKKMLYLNLNWFMPTLLDRKDRMTMSASLEARVPFTDHKLIEYLWNVPFSYKYKDNIEKSLLRKAFSDILPKEIVERKKSPYPKTHHPKYTKIMANLLKNRVNRPDCILHKIFDQGKIEELIQTKGSSFTVPWFGQLMTGPQLLAYLYQFDLWAEEYNVILDI